MFYFVTKPTKTNARSVLIDLMQTALLIKSCQIVATTIKSPPKEGRFEPKYISDLQFNRKFSPENKLRV